MIGDFVGAFRGAGDDGQADQIHVESIGTSAMPSSMSWNGVREVVWIERASVVSVSG